MESMRGSQVFADNLLANVVTVMDERFSTMERQIGEHMRTQQDFLDTKLHDITRQITAELDRFLDRQPTGGRSRVRGAPRTEEEANTDGDSESTRRDEQDIRPTIASPSQRISQQADGASLGEQLPTPNLGTNAGIGSRRLAITISDGVVHFPGSDTPHAPPTGDPVYIANADGPSVLVGRTVDNTIQVSGPDVSRSHFEIRYCSQSARWEVKDVGSTTGTFFLLRPRQNCPMFPGLVVKMGETEFIVESCDVEASSMVLLCNEGPREGHRLTVGQAEFNIGRRATNHLVLPDESASSHHAHITFSTTPSAWHEIFDEDVVVAGQTKFSCRIQIGAN